MLVLTREIGQSVTIDHDIIVRFLGLDRRGKLRIGFEAPREKVILRDNAIKRKEHAECDPE